MGAHAQRFGYARPTRATVLAGVRWRDRHDPTPGPCCLGFEEAAELRPAGIAEALAERAVPYQVGDPQVFEVERVVRAHEGERHLVVEVAPLPPDVLMGFGEQHHGLLPTVAALLP